jgi:hypothetical protein
LLIRLVQQGHQVFEFLLKILFHILIFLIKEKSTFRYRPWDLVWKCKKKNKSEAYRLEMKLKNLSRKKVMEFIDKYSVDDGVGGPDVTAYRQSG